LVSCPRPPSRRANPRPPGGPPAKPCPPAGAPRRGSPPKTLGVSHPAATSEIDAPVSAAAVEQFIHKWERSELKERSAAHQHFTDLCRVLNHPAPTDVDLKGDTFCFEKGAKKLGGGKGYADVWKRDCFAWEYKGKRKNLGEAYLQVLEYREALENPPLLIVCDTDRFEIHTNFTGTAKKIYAFSLSGLRNVENLKVLRYAFLDPGRLKPTTTATAVTKEAAARVSRLAESLEKRGVEPRNAAHFLMQIVFCMFAEHAEILPNRLFSELLRKAKPNPSAFEGFTKTLFSAMAKGGTVGFESIPWFNGGLFTDDQVIPLREDELEMLYDVSKLDWAPVEPSIFGTLFERGLDPKKRQQIGAHYTSPDDIRAILEPVVFGPLREEWSDAKGETEAHIQRAARAKSIKTRRDARKKAEQCVGKFLERLRTVRILDPACGSGNFLYLALRGLKDLEGEVIGYAARRELGSFLPFVSPEQLYGIEIDPYAHELAQVVVWIGHLQWLYHNAFIATEKPILKAFENIRCGDALLPATEEWPEADFIVGNPPFLGGKHLRGRLSDAYVHNLFDAYHGSVGRESDFVCYWFERARRQIESGRAKRAGLVATNTIRAGSNRNVIDRIKTSGDVFMAWSDRPWIQNDASVRVSMIGFDNGTESTRTLDGVPTQRINADLTESTDLTGAARLRENRRVVFQGDTKSGAFELTAEQAKAMLDQPNPLGRSNRKVLRPWVNAKDITGRHRSMWIIDFGVNMIKDEAALYQAPFEYVRKHIKPKRDTIRRKQYREKWWIHAEPRPAMRKALGRLKRYIATPRVAKHRLFVWLQAAVLPDSRLYAIARDDDQTFGVLHSRVHEVWSLHKCSWHGGERPTYNVETCFETFPFPRPNEQVREAIEVAARGLHETRQSKLDADPSLTLTSLYNERPTWLDNCHRRLDTAVMGAYGWPIELDDDEILARLLALNLERAAAESIPPSPAIRLVRLSRSARKRP